MLSDVLVPLFGYPEETEEESLPSLARFLDTFAAHVTFCGVEIDVPNLADRWGAQLVALPQMAAEFEQRSRAQIALLLAAAAAAPAKYQSDPLKLRGAFLDPGFALAKQARNHDVTLLQMPPGSESMKTIAEHLLFGSARPLMLVPVGSDLPADMDRIAIAWDGGPAAARAVYDAMSIIVRAKDVIILTAPEDKDIDTASIDALARYLRRHGVEPKVGEASAGRNGIGSDLQVAAAAQQACLLVMGGYGHSRLREFILGGATVGVLGHATMPIFLSR